MFERLTGRLDPWQKADFPSFSRHLRQEKGGKVLAVPAFMAATTIMLARSSSSADRGQTCPLVVQSEARKAS
jgi:hypothetical protein